MSASSAIRAGRAFVELFLDDSKLIGGLRSAQKRIAAFGSSVSSVGTKLFGLGAAATAPFLAAIKAGSDMQETMNKFDVVFGRNAAAMKAWGDGFASQVGRSKQQVAAFLAGTQDLLVPLGFESGAAEEMSKQLTGLAVDLASFNNLSDDDVLRDLQAALTGSGEVMKKYGVLVSEAAVKQELLNQGLDPSNASDQEKVMARLAIIMRGTTAAQGDAIRSAGSFANQMKALKATVADTAAAIGTTLLPIVTPWITKAAEIGKEVAAWAAKNEDVIITVAKVAAGVALAGGALTAIGATIQGVAFALGGFTTALTLASTVMKAAQTNSIGFRVGLAGLAAAGITALAIAVYKANPALKELNRQLEIGRGLSSQLSEAQQRKQQNFMADVAVLPDADSKRSAISDKLQEAQKELAGLQAQVKGSEAEVARLGSAFNKATGNKLLAGAEQNLEETRKRMEDAKRWITDLQDAQKQVDREEKLIQQSNSAPAPGESALPAPPDLTKAQEEFEDVMKRLQGGGAGGGKPGGLLGMLIGDGSPLQDLWDRLTSGMTTTEEVDKNVTQAASHPGTFSSMADRMFASNDSIPRQQLDALNAIKDNTRPRRNRGLDYQP